LSSIEDSISVYFSGMIYGVEAYKWMEMSPKEKEEQILKFRRKVSLIENMCRGMEVDGVIELGKRLRKEFRIALRDIANLKKCGNCRHCANYYDMSLDKAKNLVIAYLKKKGKDDVIDEVRNLTNHRKLKEIIEKHLPESRNALIGVIYNIGPYCLVYRACIREQTIALICRYFSGR